MMEKKDEMLIRAHMSEDAELRSFVEAHERYEKELEALNKKVYLTPDEEIAKKNLQKQKLRGKEQIYRILQKYRDVAGN